MGGYSCLYIRVLSAWLAFSLEHSLLARRGATSPRTLVRHHASSLGFMGWMGGLSASVLRQSLLTPRHLSCDSEASRLALDTSSQIHSPRFQLLVLSPPSTNRGPNVASPTPSHRDGRHICPLVTSVEPSFTRHASESSSLPGSRQAKPCLHRPTPSHRQALALGGANRNSPTASWRSWPPTQPPRLSGSLLI